ncbi:hypothetical protein [Chondromyces crocatus]|uniref:Secreted protein n=1 Tax=Chondromyces crocatus TaxID=52 RepID=A0A0K1EIR1_CHOCO|nr:hypothetical protein [Chondromyces crocatus]AKT40749.1 uncharacterized protein CMC5_049050 [Chondromyces crocatus]
MSNALGTISVFSLFVVALASAGCLADTEDEPQPDANRTERVAESDEEVQTTEELAQLPSQEICTVECPGGSCAGTQLCICNGPSPICY